MIEGIDIWRDAFEHASDVPACLHENVIGHAYIVSLDSQDLVRASKLDDGRILRCLESGMDLGGQREQIAAGFQDCLTHFAPRKASRRDR
jgi:hypothetical protein